MLRQAGVLAPERSWPGRRISAARTFAGETETLVFRGFLSYLLGLLGWLLVCSVVGRAGRAAEEVGGQAAA